MSNLAEIDREDQALLNSLKPEGAMPGSDPNDVPTDEAAAAAASALAPADAPAASPAPAAPAAAPAAAAPEPAAAPAAAAPAAPAPAPAEPQGDPRAALRASRAAEKRLRDELRAKDAELAALREKAGTPSADQEPEDYTEDQLEDLKVNFPLQYRMVMDLRDLKARVAAPAPAPAQPAAPATEWKAPEFDPVVQEVIDAVPQLQAWQYSQADQPKFDMAAQFDESLRHHPDWKTKPATERFQEAVRLTQQRFGAAPSPAPQADPAALAAQRIAAAPATAPAAIHDFRGGGPAAAPALDFNRMSDEAILASLKPDA